MTTTTKIDLQKSYTVEEKDAMLEAYADALERGDDEAADHILDEMPIDAYWAKSIRNVMGADYLKEHFNITEANRVFGEGWLDA